MTAPAHDHVALVTYVEMIAQGLNEARQAAAESATKIEPACQVCLATASLFSQLEPILWLWRWAHIAAADRHQECLPGKEEKTP